ncbi:protein shuttle craft-like isoform X2 [Babylonia areolata]|uniref:protein shuttle craft-like isoform X2 n=1 Tax=Babylonia areolata TaxID=304850 RepID=UPI003FD13210
MRSVRRADHSSPVFCQPSALSFTAMSLSPYAPAFNPRVPPPNMFPPRGHGRGHPNNPPRFPPPDAPPVVDNSITDPQSFQHIPFDAHSSPDFVATQQFAGHRGGYHNQNGYRGGRGNWHRGHRGRGRDGQSHSFSQNSRQGNHSYQYGNSSGRRPRRHQTHVNERHSRNEYGDLLYSHADSSNTGNGNAGNSGDDRYQPHSFPVNSEHRSAGNSSQRNLYVRKVDQYRNRENGNPQEGARGAHAHHRGRGGGRDSYRQSRDEAMPPDPQGRTAAEQDGQNRSGARSAPPGQRRSTGNKAEADGGSETKVKDRRAQMEEQLKRGQYECMVCCDNIRQEVAVWNCQKCYCVFHLRCIKQWVKSSLEAEEDIWRCPTCQNSNTARPKGYRCFCGKVKDPKFQPGETPHGCGEVCGRKGKDGCTHKCVLLCHPGPCPPCSAVIARTCDCGAEKKMMRCDQTATFKCEKVCGKELNCGEHQCQIVCHKEDCLPCQVALQQECYGGHKKREVLCGSEQAVMLSYSCQQPCSKNLKCGNHVCEDLCHPGDCGDCPLIPDLVKHCCCGQTRLTDIDAPPRISCLDPVPTCTMTCNRPMTCGPPDNPHICQQTCHEGPCGQCEGVTTLTCVCGANQKDFPCSELEQFSANEPFKCERKCNKKRMCGRHKCNELCCTRDVHICEIVCGRPLSCGLHKCEELCHRGNCRHCLQASFEELTCHCGAEVMEPPVPCGTKPPTCHRICTRQHNCDHPVRHTCHSEDACPPCAELVQKMCMGDHQLRRNVPCYLPDISCGRPCGKALPCGQHKCIKTCHKGPCLSEGEACVQPCLKKRSECPHPCAAPCHPQSDTCPQTICRAQMEIKCACGHRTAKVQCQAGSNVSAEIAQFQRLTVQAMASGGPGQDIDISQLTPQKKNTARQLECDSTCAILERNRRVALALEIQNPDLDAKLNGPKYSDFLKESARKYPAFVTKVEKNFTDLVQNAKTSKQLSRSFAFPSMNREQRRVVHELAESYGCETQSYDYEPNKNVVATAHRNRCFAPSVSLMASVSRNKAPPPIPHHTKTVAAWGADKLVTSLFKEEKGREKEKEKADIDYFDFSSK